MRCSFLASLVLHLPRSYTHRSLFVRRPRSRAKFVIIVCNHGSTKGSSTREHELAFSNIVVRDASLRLCLPHQSTGFHVIRRQEIKRGLSVPVLDPNDARRCLIPSWIRQQGKATYVMSAPASSKLSTTAFRTSESPSLSARWSGVARSRRLMGSTSQSSCDRMCSRTLSDPVDALVIVSICAKRVRQGQYILTRSGGLMCVLGVSHAITEIWRVCITCVS